jgi:flagellar assembly factor FliW
VSAALLSADLLAASELHLEAGLPGFPGFHRFGLAPWGAEPGPFLLLSCLDDDDLAFVVMAPEVFFPAYQPELRPDALQRLGLASRDEAVILLIVTLGRRPEEATANLLGPLVINGRTGAAAQVVLDGTRYDVRTPLRSESAA